MTDAQRRARHVEHVNVLRKEHKIYVEGTDVPPPLLAFADLAHAPLKAPAFLVHSITLCEYAAPTPIQMQTIPILMSRRDLIACAPTGSGKTCAYLIPILAVLKAPGKTGFRAVVLSPTRELAAQIHREAERLCVGRKFRIHHLTKANAQANNFGPDAQSQKHDVLITSPMRLVHMIRHAAIDLSHVQLLVHIFFFLNFGSCVFFSFAHVSCLSLMCVPMGILHRIMRAICFFTICFIRWCLAHHLQS